MRLPWTKKPEPADPLAVLCASAGWTPPPGEPGTIVSAGLAEFVLQPTGDDGPLRRALAACEQILAEPETESVKVIGQFFEDVQNACSLGLGDLPSVEGLLGPDANQVWMAAAAFWQRVADATPERTKVPPDLAGVQNNTLRWMLLASYRRMADGSYVHITDILRYEQTV
jgi:hypothetical protein